VAAEMLGIETVELEAVDHRIRSKTFPEKQVALADVASRAQIVRGRPPLGSASFNPPTVPMDPETGQGKPFATYVYATQVAEVEVDDETGEVEVLRICAAHDSGTTINPALTEGQIEGGIAMGIGMALEEEMLFDADGRQVNANLTNYLIPTSLDMPKIEVDIVQSYDPVGPFGAKGVGEPTLVPTMPAILNAIYDAVGVRIADLPATAEKILMAIKEKERAELKQLGPA
jgi:CO/xanthine dehydrogenase Mo-binding subunit